jgi:hypothetical protein
MMQFGVVSWTDDNGAEDKHGVWQWADGRQFFEHELELGSAINLSEELL